MVAITKVKTATIVINLLLSYSPLSLKSFTIMDGIIINKLCNVTIANTPAHATDLILSTVQYTSLFSVRTSLDFLVII